MTPEQKKVVERCAAMLKLIFPGVAGKMVFRLLNNQREVKIELTQYGVVNSADKRLDGPALGDIITEEDVIVNLKG